MNRLLKNSWGDTIVEVLLAVAIVGFILAISYSLSTRSLKVSRTAQERGEALKIAEQQFERLKAKSNSPSASEIPFTYNSDGSTPWFCIDSNLKIIPEPKRIDDPQQDPLLTAPPRPAGYYDPACISGLYYTIMDWEPSGANNIFILTVRWHGLTGINNEVKMVYKLHEP